MYVCMYVSVYLSKGKETAAPPYVIYICMCIYVCVCVCVYIYIYSAAPPYIIYIYIVIGCMLAWMQVDVDQ